MTKLASYRRLVPTLFALGWVGCGGGGPQVVSDPFTGGSTGFDPNSCSGNGINGLTGFGGSIVSGPPQFGPQLGTTYSQSSAPPAISGGTLLVLSDGKTAVAADPDRDAIYVVDLPSRTVTQTITLQPGDEPGRLVEDGAGHVHVALRRGGAVVTCDPAGGKVITRRPVCPAPRGLAYERGTDRVHVACHDGQLVSLPAGGGDAVRRVQLDDDLRDVMVDGNNLLVTRFRSAELLTVGADGTVIGRTQPPSFSSPQAHSGSLFTPSIAWRTLAAPDGGTLMLHQRGMVDPVMPAPGGYGGLGPCDTIVHGCITHIGRDGSTRSGPALASLVLAVDMAISPDGKQVAVVSAGNATNTNTFSGASTPALTRVFLTDLTDATSPQIGCSMDGMHGPCTPGTQGPFPGTGGAIGGCCNDGLGGSLGAGGRALSGTGGAPATGGVTGAGGAIPRCCDVPNTGGAIGAGGSVGTGGSIATGGVPGTGGDIGKCCAAPGSGGITGAGGALGMGGAIGPCCGSPGSGGITGNGGALGMGGFTNTGGAFGTGGNPGGFGGSIGTVCSSGPVGVPFVVGQPIAVAFDGSGVLVVQSREPAMLALGDGATITLSTASRGDTGHTLFHANSGGFLACASCHAEGNEDGRTWNFSCEGPRRTQSLQTGLAGTEPFHWDGTETDFTHLMTDVFQGRMSGPPLANDQGAALLSWLDRQPRAPKAQPADPTAVDRGKALFQDPIHACATCHTGPHMTNNLTVDVGTGGQFQVPSLIGVGSRGPYMHDGCAATLEDRFGPCGGGDRHGFTSSLSPGDISDLIAFLKTL